MNLIGEHIDYNGGKVFPCALTFGTYGLVSKREDKKFRVYSINFEKIGVIKFDLSKIEYKKEDDWANYIKGMIDSHNSLRDLYEVTGKELDTLVEESLKCEGVIGARMTGAGFGGCIVSLVKNDKIDSYIENVKREYKNKVGLEAEFYIATPGEGARKLGDANENI